MAEESVRAQRLACLSLMNAPGGGGKGSGAANRAQGSIACSRLPPCFFAWMLGTRICSIPGVATTVRPFSITGKRTRIRDMIELRHCKQTWDFLTPGSWRVGAWPVAPSETWSVLGGEDSLWGCLGKPATAATTLKAGWSLHEAATQAKMISRSSGHNNDGLTKPSFVRLGLMER